MVVTTGWWREILLDLIRGACGRSEAVLPLIIQIDGIDGLRRYKMLDGDGHMEITEDEMLTSLDGYEHITVKNQGLADALRATVDPGGSTHSLSEVIGLLPHKWARHAPDRYGTRRFVGPLPGDFTTFLMNDGPIIIDEQEENAVNQVIQQAMQAFGSSGCTVSLNNIQIQTYCPAGAEFCYTAMDVIRQLKCSEAAWAYLDDPFMGGQQFVQTASQTSLGAYDLDSQDRLLGEQDWIPLEIVETSDSASEGASQEDEESDEYPLFQNGRNEELEALTLNLGKQQGISTLEERNGNFIERMNAAQGHFPFYLVLTSPFPFESESVRWRLFIWWGRLVEAEPLEPEAVGKHAPESVRRLREYAADIWNRMAMSGTRVVRMACDVRVCDSEIWTSTVSVWGGSTGPIRSSWVDLGYWVLKDALPSIHESPNHDVYGHLFARQGIRAFAPVELRLNR